MKVKGNLFTLFIFKQMQKSSTKIRGYSKNEELILSHIVQSLYNTPRYNMDLDITWLCCAQWGPNIS